LKEAAGRWPLLLCNSHIAIITFIRIILQFSELCIIFVSNSFA